MQGCWYVHRAITKHRPVVLGLVFKPWHGGGVAILTRTDGLFLAIDSISELLGIKNTDVKCP
jgi:hypothetical protein